MLVTAIEDALQLDAPSNLRQGEKASLILAESKGLIGLIVKLLFRAGSITVTQKEPAISLKALRRAAVEIKAPNLDEG